MTRITPTEFFTRAIVWVPYRDPQYPTRYFHLGIRTDVLRKPFTRYFGSELNFDETLDSLIKEKVVVAVHLVWGGETDRRRPTEVERLQSFPDPSVEDTNPILYLPQTIPKPLKARLNRTEEILNKILQPILIAVNS